LKYKDTFLKKGYEPKTAGIYSRWLERLEEHYPSKSLNEISFDEIKEYANVLEKRKKLGTSSRIQAKKARFNFGFYRPTQKVKTKITR
tara:strand:- start:1625 stop:1888 length:264 start_codon:yes stop_codon:yes gene_type:complete